MAKVIFSQACVKNSVHGGGGSPIFREGCVSNFSGGLQFWGVSNFSGGVPPNFRGGVSGLVPGGGSPPEYGQRSAGTHPTGMHSCSYFGFKSNMLLLS